MWCHNKVDDLALDHSNVGNLDHSGIKHIKVKASHSFLSFFELQRTKDNLRPEDKCERLLLTREMVTDEVTGSLASLGTDGTFVITNMINDHPAIVCGHKDDQPEGCSRVL